MRLSCPDWAGQLFIRLTHWWIIMTHKTERAYTTTVLVCRISHQHFVNYSLVYYRPQPDQRYNPETSHV